MSLERPTVAEARDFGIDGLWYRAGTTGNAVFYRVHGTPSKGPGGYHITIEVPSEDGVHLVMVAMNTNDYLYRGGGDARLYRRKGN